MCGLRILPFYSLIGFNLKSNFVYDFYFQFFRFSFLLVETFKWGRKQEAEVLFDSMLDSHTSPVVHKVNFDTFNLMVNECIMNRKGSEAYSAVTGLCLSVRNSNVVSHICLL